MNKNNGTALVRSVFVATILLSLIAVFSRAYFYTPIAITNSQSQAIPAMAQMVSFNPSAYSSYVSSDLGNIRFYQGSNTLYSWCESGCSASSSNAVFWVSVPSIGSNSNTIIRMAFLPTSIEYDGVYAGEAPQLSSTYAQYDNGKKIFPFYDNFKGSTPAALNATLWGPVNSGSLSINDGLTLNTGYQLSSNAVWNTNAYVLDAYAYYNQLPEGGSNLVGFGQEIGYFNDGTGGYTVLGDGSSNCPTSHVYTFDTYTGTPSDIASDVCTSESSNTAYNLFSIYSTGSADALLYNYNLIDQNSAAYANITNSLIRVASFGGAFGNIYVQWIRLRPIQTTEAPALSFGAISSSIPIVSVTPTSETIALDQFGTFNSVVTGGSGTYTYKWYYIAPSSNVVLQNGNNTINIFGAQLGTGYFYLSVNDGTYTSNSTAFSLTTEPKLYSSTAMPSNSATADNNQSTISITANGVGGTGPYIYSFYPASGTSCPAAAPQLSNTMRTLPNGKVSASFVPNAISSNCVIDVLVKDSAGNSDVLSTNTINIGPSMVLSTPTSISVVQGQTATLTTIASGGVSGYTYQWLASMPNKASGFSQQVASILCSAGTTGSTCNFATNAGTPAGTYSFMVTGTDSATFKGATTSNTVTVTVIAAPNVSITSSVSSIALGNQLTLAANASKGSGTFTYQWYSGQSPICSQDSQIASQTASSYTFAPTAQSTYYCVKVTDSVSGASTFSNPLAVISEVDGFAVEASPYTTAVDVSAQNSNNGGEVTLTGTPLGLIGTPTYSWYLTTGGGVQNSASPFSFYPTNTGTGMLYLSVSNGIYTANSLPVAFTVNSKPQLVSTTPTIFTNYMNNLTIEAAFNGGIAPYNVILYSYQLGTSCGTGNVVASTSFNYTIPGGLLSFFQITPSSQSGLYCAELTDTPLVAGASNYVLVTPSTSTTTTTVTTTTTTTSGGGGGGGGGSFTGGGTGGGGLPTITPVKTTVNSTTTIPIPPSNTVPVNTVTTTRSTVSTILPTTIAPKTGAATPPASSSTPPSSHNNEIIVGVLVLIALILIVLYAWSRRGNKKGSNASAVKKQ